MDVKAKVVAKSSHKNLRVSPYKARLVVDQIRGKPVFEALRLLTFSKKRVSVSIEKVLRSAIANAEFQGTVNVDELFLSEVYVDKSKTYKRYRPRARGRMDQEMKRGCHINLALSEKGS